MMRRIIRFFWNYVCETLFLSNIIFKGLENDQTKTTMKSQEIIIYNTDDGKTSVSLMTKDGNVWLNQQMLAELFDTSVPNISMHISNILNDNELDAHSVIKDYLTTASDGKNYNVTFYSLDMMTIGKNRKNQKKEVIL